MRRLLLLVFLFSAIGTPAFAQAEVDLSETFTTSDGTFQFHYPTRWLASEDNNGSVTVTNGKIGLVVIPPGKANIPARIEAKLHTDIDFLLSFVLYNGSPFVYEEAEPITLESGLRLLRTDFSTDFEEYAALTAGFVLAVPVDDTYAFINAFGFGVTETDMEPVAYAISETLQRGTFATPADDTVHLPVLKDYGRGDLGSDWEPAIAELRALDLIPDGGSLIYSEPILSGTFSPGILLDDGSASVYGDVAMGALISYQAVGNQTSGMCGLIAHGTYARDGSVAGHLSVSATSANRVVVIERDESEQPPFIFESDEVADFSDPQHLLVLVRGDTVSAFVNGQPVIENLTLDVPFDASAATKILVGTGLDQGCVMTGAWAYGLPSADE